MSEGATSCKEIVSSENTEYNKWAICGATVFAVFVTSRKPGNFMSRHASLAGWCEQNLNCLLSYLWSFQLIAGQVWFCCFVYMCFLQLFFSSAMVKLQINNLLFAWLPIWPLIKSCDITKEFVFWKLRAVCWFPKELSLRLILPP